MKTRQEALSCLRARRAEARSRCRMNSNTALGKTQPASLVPRSLHVGYLSLPPPVRCAASAVLGVYHRKEHGVEDNHEKNDEDHCDRVVAEQRPNRPRPTVRRRARRARRRRELGIFRGGIVVENDVGEAEVYQRRLVNGQVNDAAAERARFADAKGRDAVPAAAVAHVEARGSRPRVVFPPLLCAQENDDLRVCRRDVENEGGIAYADQGDAVGRRGRRWGDAEMVRKDAQAGVAVDKRLEETAGAREKVLTASRPRHFVRHVKAAVDDFVASRQVVIRLPLLRLVPQPEIPNREHGGRHRRPVLVRALAVKLEVLRAHVLRHRMAERVAEENGVGLLHRMALVARVLGVQRGRRVVRYDDARRDRQPLGRLRRLLRRAHNCARPCRKLERNLRDGVRVDRIVHSDGVLVRRNDVVDRIHRHSAGYRHFGHPACEELCRAAHNRPALLREPHVVQCELVLLADGERNVADPMYSALI
eukprot:Opistho-1_new@47326